MRMFYGEPQSINFEFFAYKLRFYLQFSLFLIKAHFSFKNRKNMTKFH